MLPRAGMSAGPIHGGGWVPEALASCSGSGLALGRAWRVLLPEQSWRAPLGGLLGPSLREALGCGVCVCVCVCVHAQMCYILRTRDFHLDPFHAPCVLVAQSCLTLGDPKDCNPPGSSVHGILQARMLEWAAIPFTRGSSQHSDQTPPAGGFFTAAPPGKLLLGRPSCFLPKDSASGDAHRMDSASGDTHRIKCLLMTEDSVV